MKRSGVTKKNLRTDGGPNFLVDFFVYNFRRAYNFRTMAYFGVFATAKILLLRPLTDEIKLSRQKLKFIKVFFEVLFSSRVRCEGCSNLYLVVCVVLSVGFSMEVFLRCKFGSSWHSHSQKLTCFNNNRVPFTHLEKGNINSFGQALRKVHYDVGRVLRYALNCFARYYNLYFGTRRGRCDFP